MDLFAQILFDLGKEVGIELYPDTNRLCQLNFNDEFHLQLQLEEAKEQLLIAAFLCDVPAGKYREKLFNAALIHNHDFPHFGTLAYSERNNQLTLFQYLPVQDLTGEKLFKFLSEFIEMGKSWRDAVENGRPLPTQTKKGNNDSMFGLKP